MLTTETILTEAVSTPLSPALRDEALAVVGRLRSELGRLVASLPAEGRGASAMARTTGVLRVTCQRVVGALESGGDGVGMLARLPGVEGLRLFVDGFVRAGIPTQDVASARAAVEAFDRLITHAGGSHAKLIRLVQEQATPAPVGDTALATPEQRRELFRAAAAVTGRRCRVAFSIYAFRPRPGDDATLERVLVKGLIGGIGTPGGMPFVLASGNTLTEAEAGPRTLDSGAPLAENAPEAIMRAFTSNPLPTISARGTGGNVYQVVDAPALTAASAAGLPVPFDIVTALRGSAPMLNPSTGRPTLSSVWSLVSCPSESLILDVYLHRSIERRFRPGLECLLWQAELDIPPERRWSTRVPNPPRLQLLGEGIGHSASEMYARHGEVTAAMFAQSGFQPEEFIGFRCEVRWPVWRAGYCLTIDEAGA